MVIPLYEGLGIPELTISEPGITEKTYPSHKGLWFERFFNKYDHDWTVRETVKQSWVDTVSGSCGDPKALQSHAISQNQLCESLQGKNQIFKNNWHFVTGMGNSHPVENGMTWHPTLGTPYLTGASVKGLLRTWVEEWSGLEGKELKEKLHHWFGSDDKDPTKQQQESQAGALVFFDAIPVTSVELVCDIMTPHMGKWYSDGGKITKKTYSETLPADWHNPIPIPFLVVKEASLLFSIAPRPHAKVSTEELEDLMQMLIMALEYLGAGAKTATGYGRFEIDTIANRKLEKALKEAARTGMGAKDRFVDTLKDIDEKTLAEMFGKDFKKTQEIYQKCPWDTIINTLMSEKKSLISSWESAKKNTAQGKAYKKLKNYL